MNGLDLEGVLAAHDIRWLPGIPAHNVGCAGCDWTAHRLTDDAAEDAHRAHVAAVLREQVAEAQAEAWDESAVEAVARVIYKAGGGIHWEGEDGFWRERSMDQARAVLNMRLLNRAAQLAPARVPSEEG